MFKKHPTTTFFNIHFGCYANDLGKLSQLPDEMPNMQVLIAGIIAELGRQPANARAFFIKYQDRIHFDFGKDNWVFFKLALYPKVSFHKCPFDHIYASCIFPD